MCSFHITNNDLTNYNRAKNPVISIDCNGNIDILKNYGDDDKISFYPNTIIRLVTEMLENSGYMLNYEDSIKLINLLEKKRFYRS